MSDLNGLTDAQEPPEDIVHWQPGHGPLVGSGKLDGAVAVAATLGALAMLGVTLWAFLAGRASRK